MDLPVLDYAYTSLPNDPIASAATPQPWSDEVIQSVKEAQGDLATSESRPAVGRRLLQTDSSTAQRASNNLPTVQIPGTVFVSADGTFNDVRMLPHDPSRNRMLLTLFQLPNCDSTSQSIQIPVGMDTCPGSPIQMYPDGGFVSMNFSSVLVPPGLSLQLTDGCEYSQPVNNGMMSYGTILSQTDNSAGVQAVCWNVPKGRFLRLDNRVADTNSPRNSLLSYRILADGRNQVGPISFN
jgi:hypothetical protein